MAILGLFPGQGSQKVGMAGAWLEVSEQAKELFELADSTLGFSLSSLCLEGPIEELTLTHNAQPALLLSAYTSYVCSGISIDSAAGHSLGEYTALVASGVISFEDAIQLVHKRGRYMQEAVPLGEGAMLAVMGADEAQLKDLISEHAKGVVEIANINSPGQIVLAGTKEAIDAFAPVLSDNSFKAIPLNVSAPFHCSLMENAKIALAKDLDVTKFKDPSIPVYANVTARKITSGEEAKELLKEQVCGTVRWTEQILNMIENENLTQAIEFGPGGVLTKLLKRIHPGTSRFSVESPETAEKTKGALA